MATYYWTGTSGSDYYDHYYKRYYNPSYELVNDPLNARGLGGNDTIYGDYLNDTIDGGAGNDYIHGGYDAYVYIGSSSIYYNGGDDKLQGGSGNDTIHGGGGNDSLDGGTGVDSMVGGNGDDIYKVDTDLDVVSEVSYEGFDTVQSTVTYVLTNNVEALTLLNVSTAIGGTGNNLGNNISGNNYANMLSGMNGDDYISALGGNDNVDGGAGNDQLFGGLGDDKLSGSTGNDQLTGNDGVDELIGGTGKDTLTGGNGYDKFVFKFKTEVGDTITDFQGSYGWYYGGDEIEVSLGGFGASSSSQFVFNSSDNSLYFDANLYDASLGTKIVTLQSGSGFNSYYDISFVA